MKKAPIIAISIGLLLGLSGLAFYFLKPQQAPSKATPLYLSAIYTVEKRSAEYKLPVDLPGLNTRFNIKQEDYAAYINSNPILNNSLYVYLTPTNYITLTTTNTAALKSSKIIAESDTKLLRQLLPGVLLKLASSKATILANNPERLTSRARLKERQLKRTAKDTPAPQKFPNPSLLKNFEATNSKELTYLTSLGFTVSPDSIPAPSVIDEYTLELLGSYKR